MRKILLWLGRDESFPWRFILGHYRLDKQEELEAAICRMIQKEFDNGSPEERQAGLRQIVLGLKRCFWNIILFRANTQDIASWNRFCQWCKIDLCSVAPLFSAPGSFSSGVGLQASWFWQAWADPTCSHAYAPALAPKSGSSKFTYRVDSGRVNCLTRCNQLLWSKKEQELRKTSGSRFYAIFYHRSGY